MAGCVVATAIFLGGLALPPAAGSSGAGEPPMAEAGWCSLEGSAAGVLVQAGGSALRVDFVGGRGVNPRLVTAPGISDDQVASSIAYHGIWAGVDLSIDPVPGGIAESTWTVHPGANPSSIVLRYDRPVRLAEDGSLLIPLPDGLLSETAPVAWQVIDGARRPVEVSFRGHGPREIGFSVGRHDPDRALIIDPVLQWTSYTNAPATDLANGLALDAAGNLLVTGFSDGTWGTPVRPYSGGNDAFVAKWSPSGALLWNTFLGGSESVPFDGRGQDYGRGVVVDSTGGVVVTGSSTSTWGSPVNPFAGTGTAGDVLVARLTADGALVWNTFLGSAGYDMGYAIAADGLGNVFVAGESGDTWGTPVSDYVAGWDAFVAKVNGSGTLLWNSFLGSAGDDHGLGLAPDRAGGVLVTGDSTASWGSPVNGHSGSSDVFVARVSQTGATQWNTFLGGTLADSGYGVASDAAGNALVAGYSAGPWGTPVSSGDGAGGGFVAKIAPSGSLVWSTFLSEAYRDNPAYGIATGPDGAAWVAGPNGFVAKLSRAGNLIWTQNLGAGAYPPPRVEGRAVAVDGSGMAFVAGDWGHASVAMGSPERSTAPGSGERVFPWVYRSDAFAAGIAPLPAELVAVANDFSDDARADILWRHTGGDVYLWQMDGLVARSAAFIPAIDPSWQVAALGDFNGDWATDILWRHVTGTLYTWMMQGARAVSLGSPGVVDPSWTVLAAADFGGDRKDDILWRHTGGAFYLWQMDGLIAHTIGYIPAIDPSWRVEAVADLNGDGKSDILWRHTSGMVYVWLMDGATAIGLGSPDTVDQTWKVVEAADFGGDGKADVLWRHTSGAIVIWQMNGTGIVAKSSPLAVGREWSVADAADFDGNGKADILWRSVAGDGYLWLMDGMAKSGEGSLGRVDPSWRVENR